MLSYIIIRVRVVVFNATFNNISVLSMRSVLLVKEPDYPEKTTALSVLVVKGNLKHCKYAVIYHNPV